MNILSAITPDQFVALAIGWITAVLTVLTFLLPRIAAIKAQVETLFNLHRDNSAAINTLAINTPPPSPPPHESELPASDALQLNAAPQTPQ